MATVGAAAGRRPRARLAGSAESAKRNVSSKKNDGSVEASPRRPFVAAGIADRRPAPERHVLDQFTAYVFSVRRSALRTPVRGGARVALVRQVAMYLAHVALGRSLTEVAALYGRHRTTAAHACEIVEDLREHAAFDRAIAELEHAIRLQVRQPSDAGSN